MQLDRIAALEDKINEIVDAQNVLVDNYLAVRAEVERLRAATYKALIELQRNDPRRSASQ